MVAAPLAGPARALARACRIPLLACSALALLATTTRSDVLLPNGFSNTKLVSGLQLPRGMAFLPDGRVLVTEQHTGAVRLITADFTLSPTALVTVPGLAPPQSENGLQGIAVDPRWPAEPFVYLCYNHTDDEEWLVRYRASGDLTSGSSTSLTLDDPLRLLDDLPDENWWHNAGCLRFGPDSLLYVSVGDDGEPCDAQDDASLHCAILRLEVRGLPEAGDDDVASRSALAPPTNPMHTESTDARLVYAYGFRNPWLFSIDPADGRMYTAEVGENTYEEIDAIEPGANNGWPIWEGTSLSEDIDCDPAQQSSTTYTPPIIAMPHGNQQTAITVAGRYRSHAPTSFDHGDGYDGALFWGDYFTGRIYRSEPSDAGSWALAAPAPGQPDPQAWATGLYAATDFHIGDDGALFWIQQYDPDTFASTGSLQRISRTPVTLGPGTAPVAPRPLTAGPVPARDEVRLGFSLRAGEAATLDVFDVTGRRVWSAREPAGGDAEHQERWALRDDAGRRVAPGIYLVRLETLTRSEHRRVLVVP